VAKASIVFLAPPSIWLRDLCPLAELGHLDARDSVAKPSLGAEQSNAPHLHDLNGNAYRHVRALAQLFEDLVFQATKDRDLDLRTISGLRDCSSSHIQFRTMDEYFRHPLCQAAQATQPASFKECIAATLGQEARTRLIVPAWSAWGNEGEPRVYWLNTGDAYQFAAARMLAMRDGHVHLIAADVESQHIRPKVLQDLLSVVTMVMVDSRHSEVLGLYDLLRSVDFPVLILRGLNPFATARPDQQRLEQDILLFPRASSLATGFAELLLVDNEAANFGAYLAELSRSQPTRFVTGH
jgi:hypothetical protein